MWDLSGSLGVDFPWLRGFPLTSSLSVGDLVNVKMLLDLNECVNVYAWHSAMVHQYWHFYI